MSAVDEWAEFKAEWRSKHLADTEFCDHENGHPVFCENPYDEDHYCCFCGNGDWKHHAPWCEWQDYADLFSGGDHQGEPL